MTKKIVETLLPQDKAREYCIERLKEGHTLAQELLKVLPFKKGNFFAITSEDADVSKLDQFHYGGILPLNPLERVTFQGVEYPARKQSNSLEEYAQYLDKLLGKSNNLWCVFEDVTRTRSDSVKSNIENFIAYFKDEVYYFLRGNDFSVEKGALLMRHANAMWHYMNIVTTEAVQPKEQNLTLKAMQRITAKTIHLAVGAYDMEGYVCWERTNTD